MARNTIAKGKMVRRFGENIFGNPKYDRLLEKRPNPPGQHGGLRRAKKSDYGQQLQEKQKMRYCYGLSEHQFRKVYDTANRQKGVTGTNMIMLLERRLDNMVFRMGFANTRLEARQYVSHNHFRVNGKKANIPSMLLKPGDVVELRDKTKNNTHINEALDSVMRRGVPSWLELDRDNYKATVKGMPVREEITSPVFQEQLVVELYSR